MIAPLMIGTTELVLLAGIALLLFGGKKLPELMRGMGRGVKNFREGLNEPEAPADGDTPANAPAAEADKDDAAPAATQPAATAGGTEGRPARDAAAEAEPAGTAPAKDATRHD